MWKVAPAWLGVVAVPVAACATLADLGDYHLVTSDAGTDSGLPGTTDAVAANADGSAAPDARASDASSGPDGDSEASKPPPLPPSDGAHLACGASTCNAGFEVCCELVASDSCQPALSMCTAGVIARCDEAANCPGHQPCCVTRATATGLEASCQASCPASTPQSCRTDAECGSSGSCIAWACAGRVVATCGGAGANTGCP